MTTPAAPFDPIAAITNPNYCTDREAADTVVEGTTDIDVACKAMERFAANGERMVDLGNNEVAVVVATATPIGTRRVLEVWFKVDGYVTRSACQVSARDVSSEAKVRRLAAELRAS